MSAASYPPESETRNAKRPLRVLTLATVDITLGKVLLPLISALRNASFVSECASADGPYARQLRADGFKVHSISFRRRVLTPIHLLAFVQVYRLMRHGGYDIVHVHTPFAQVIGRVAARLAGVPLTLYTSHGFQFHESRSRLAQTVIIAIERVLGRWTDLIFTQSREDAESAVRKGIASQDRVVWIGNGIQLDRFHPGPRESVLRKELMLEPHHRVVGFIGRIVREKGVLELVEAMSNVVSKAPHARLLVVGDALPSDRDTSAKRLMLAAIADHKLEDKVCFTGRRDDIHRLLRAMDVFVLPSWREGMPLPILEAMATGLPVVATDIRGCREEVIDGETGLLVPLKCPAKLGEAILTLVTDVALSERMGSRGREHAARCFDARDPIERQLSAYYQLIEKKGL